MWVTFYIVQLIDSLFCLLSIFSHNFLRSSMILISLKIKEISLELRLCCFLLIFLVFIFNKLIAFIISPSWTIVILPVPKADVTKVCLALFTVHLVAARNSDQWHLTFGVGTKFCIGQHPLCIQAIILILFVPFNIHMTICRPVLLKSTPEAEGVPAEAIHCISICCIINLFNQVITLLDERAHFDIFIIISKRLAVPFCICLKNLFIIFQYSCDKRMLYLHIATLLHAHYFEAHWWAAFNLFFDVIGPATFAELVATI